MEVRLVDEEWFLCDRDVGPECWGKSVVGAIKWPSVLNKYKTMRSKMKHTEVCSSELRSRLLRVSPENGGPEAFSHRVDPSQEKWILSACGCANMY